MITATAEARTLRTGEILPTSLNTGFDSVSQIDPAWIWVIDGERGIESALVAAPAHGLVVLLRVAAFPWAKPANLVKLLRRVMHDCHDRGYGTYMVNVDTNDHNAAALIRIITRAGGRIFAQTTVFGGSTNIGSL